MSKSNFELTIQHCYFVTMSLLRYLPSLFGNEMLQMPRRLLRTPLRGMSVDFYMSGRKFSMPLSCLFPQNEVPPNLEIKNFLSGKECFYKMALFFAFWRTYGTKYSILGVPYVSVFFKYKSQWYWERLVTKIWLISTSRNCPCCYIILRGHENRVLRPEVVNASSFTCLSVNVKVSRGKEGSGE